MTELRFDNRVAIVTGAGRGIGREHALLLASRGARVVVNNRSAEPAEEVVKEIRAAGGQATAHVGSVADRSGAKSLVDAAFAAYGAIDILVSNAGILNFKPFAEISDAERDEMFAVHAFAAWNLAHELWPYMMERRYGRIVFTLSSAGLWGLANAAHYCSAKAMLIGLTRALAHEGAAHGINVNGIAVGGATRMTADQTPDPAHRAWAQRIIPAVAAAPPMAWLAHSDCTTTGEMFSACGRWMSRIFIGNSAGFCPTGAYTPESIRDNFAQVILTERFEIYADVAAHAADIGKRVQAAELGGD